MNEQQATKALINALFGVTSPTQQLYGAFGVSAEMAADRVIAKMIRKHDYNSEIADTLTRFEDALCDISHGKIWDRSCVIGAITTIDPHFVKDFGALVGVPTLDTVLSDVYAGLVVYHAVMKMNSGLHHEREEALLWATAHPDYAPGMCGCQIAEANTQPS
jgi:hypothetical protein